MKNDFGGHDNHHYSNIYAYAGQALGVTNTLEGHVDVFQNNTAVLTGSRVGGPQCKPPATVMGGPSRTAESQRSASCDWFCCGACAGNKYFTKSGTISECSSKGLDLEFDPGSTVAKLPSDETIIGWAKEKLTITGHVYEPQ